jgi:predicted GNAT superfamily acetyltransferase
MSDAWDTAFGAARAAGVELRALTTLEDAEAISGIMIATWGEHQLLPREMIVALAHSGNEPYGAFDGDRMIGYVLGWAGVDPQDGLHLHSHMLAALPDRRHRGVGFALKLAQRAQCLEQGIRTVRWTFDPLVSRNAWFNMGKLGAAADRFHRDFYGAMGDELNEGERSDRFMVRWDLEREPGPRSLGGEAPTVLQRGGDPAAPVPELVAPAGQAGGWVEIPREYAEVRASDPELGGAWRDASADTVEALMAAGCVAAAFDRERSAYRFVPASDVEVPA